MKRISEIIAAQTVAFVAKKEGLECPFIHLNKDLPEIRDFLAYAMMERDFNTAKELFFESQKHIEDPIIFGALLSEAVIAYNRPFKPGYQRSIRKLKASDIYKDQTLLEIHNWLERLRDKFYAHTDSNEYEDILLCIALEPDINKKAILDIYRGMPRSIGFDSNTINNFVYLTNKVLDWLDSKLNEEHLTIISHFKKMNIDELYLNAIDPNSFDSSVRKFFLEYPFN